MAILDTLKSWWNSIKKVWNDLTGWTPTTTATTPTTTNTTPNTPNLSNSTNSSVIGNVGTVVPNIQSAQTLNALVNWESSQQSTPTENVTSKGSQYYDYSANDEQKVKEKLAEREWEKDESIFDWLTKKANSIVDFIGNFDRSWDYEKEYEINKKVTNIWYDKDTNNVYTLELKDYWDDWASAQEALQNAINTYEATLNYYWWDNAPEEIQVQAFKKLYDDTKWLFVAKWDDWYWGFKRKKDLFTDEQLELLAKNNVKEWAYEPSYKQFSMYLENMGKNINLANDLKTKHNIDTSTWFDLDNSQTSRAEQVFMNRAMQWVLDIAKQNLAPEEVWEFYANAYVIAKNNFERAWETARPVFDAAAVIREKIKQGKTITQEEKKTLEYANTLDDMLNAEADSLNFFSKDHADAAYVEDWKIMQARDIFSDWRNLHQVISQWVIDAAWLQDDPNKSWIDAFQEVTNEALYNYEQSAWWWFGNAWETFQHWMWKVWEVLSEWWQQTVYGLTQLGNYAWDIWTYDFQSAKDRFTWKKAWTKMWEYLNQDFTIGTMINTEENWFLSTFWQDFSRTFRKYWAKAVEYWPEFAANIIPDIMLTAASWWWWGVGKVATKLPTITKLISKWAELTRINSLMNKISWANQIRKAIGWIRWLEEAAASLSRSWEVPSWTRFAAGRMGKLIKDWIIDQAIDWQYNMYDTEAYSDISFGLSLAWTGLFEILPWLRKSWAFKQIRNLVTNEYLTKGTAWDAIEFLGKEENQNILKNLTSKYAKNWELTFDDFRKIASNMEELWWILEKNWNAMPDYLKPSVNKWNKEMTWRILNQVYDVDANSVLWRNIRAIISKEWTNLADLYKFIGNIPWDVKVWPWRSVIKIKNADGTTKGLLWIEWTNAKPYSIKLDTILDWWLTKKLENWFSLVDINKIKSLPEYSNVTDSMFMLDKDWKYYITKEWVNALGISSVDMPLEYHARELAKAEAWDVSEQFRSFMKEINSSKKNIQPDTIDEIANSWTYQDVRDKVADIVC